MITKLKAFNNLTLIILIQEAVIPQTIDTNNNNKNISFST